MSYLITKNQYITVEGNKIAYRELSKGKSKLPLLMLVHLAATLDNWDPKLLDLIAEKHHVIVVDLPGVGVSQGKVAPTIPGMAEQTIAFVNLLTQSEKCDEILDKLSQKMKLTEPYRVMNEKSLYQRRDRKKEAFVPQAVTEVTEQADSEEMNEYVLKPLYTQKEIREFRKQNEQDGNFIVTKDTVKSMEDLEKLFLVWQDATEVAEGTEEIEVGEELENENGLRFSKLVIKKSQ